jgi:hypothetical protein
LFETGVVETVTEADGPPDHGKRDGLAGSQFLEHLLEAVVGTYRGRGVSRGPAYDDDGATEIYRRDLSLDRYYVY